MRHRIDTGLSIDDLRAAKDSTVYVMNHTVLVSRRKESSIISITVHLPNGGPKLLIVPSTWIPVDLAMQITKTVLLESSEFLGVVNRRMVKILSKAEAEKILDDDEAQIEHLKVIDRLNNVPAELDEFDDDIVETAEGQEDDPPQNKLKKLQNQDRSPAERILDNISPKVADLCTREDLTARDVQSQLRLIASTMTVMDLEYLSVNLPPSSRDVKLNTWINESMRTAKSSQHSAHPDTGFGGSNGELTDD